MNKLLCSLLFFSVTLSAQAQYLPVVKQNRVWYSFYQGMWKGTAVLGVGADTTIAGRTLPTLVALDQNQNVTRVEGTLAEDTVLGILNVEFFNGYGYTLDFSASQGDSTKFDLISGDSAYLKVVRTYSLVDYRNVTRKVLELQVPPQAFCNGRKITIVEGIGPLGSLVNPNYDCSVSDIPWYSLRCVFDGGEKIYGDTVQQCFVLSDDDSNEINALSVFPNPAGDFLKVEAEQQMHGYEIYNSSGAMFQSGEIQNGLISIKALRPGSYFINLISKSGENYRKQFVKS